MRKVLRSFGHAKEGLIHALRRERNFRLFFISYAIVLAYAYYLGVSPAEAVALLLSGGAFLTVELLNTALERLVDAVHEHRTHEHNHSSHHPDLKATKDTAAAASLVALIFFGCVAVLVFGPYIGVF